MMQAKTNQTMRKTTLRIPEELAAAVERMAKDDKRSFNQMVNIILGVKVEQRSREQLHGNN